MWVKICGIRDEAGLHAAADAGADAIGLNLYDRSPRYIDVERAAELVAKLPQAISPVGLFVNESAEKISEICRHCSIGLAQLHGDPRKVPTEKSVERFSAQIELAESPAHYRKCGLEVLRQAFDSVTTLVLPSSEASTLDDQVRDPQLAPAVG